MSTYSVTYQGGISRNSSEAVDFMRVVIDDVELYAELPAVEGNETATYDDLKKEIITQAKAAGIDPSSLHFFYDETDFSKIVEDPFSPVSYIVRGSSQESVDAASANFEKVLDFYMRVPVDDTTGHIINSRQSIEKKFNVDIRLNL